MQHAIVEGEPGIFPDPVARIMRKVAGWFDRGARRERSGGEESTAGGPPPGDGETDDTDRPETSR